MTPKLNSPGDMHFSMISLQNWNLSLLLYPHFLLRPCFHLLLPWESLLPPPHHLLLSPHLRLAFLRLWILFDFLRFLAIWVGWTGAITDA